MKQECAALKSALAIVKSPPLVHDARESPIPPGMTFLLEVAAGDRLALAAAADTSGHSEKHLRDAATFYIEQVLLFPDSGSHRVLGGTANTNTATLRRHMALLLKWLHPDVSEYNGGGPAGIDRSLFANRITAAWEDLKTVERRQAYERRTCSDSKPDRSGQPGGSAQKQGAFLSELQQVSKETERRRRRNRLVIVPLGGDTLVGRLMSYVRRRP